mgnify:CR=1 FL=1
MRNLPCSYWFSSILMWTVNADENMQRKKQFARFRMLQIEEDQRVYVYLYLCNAACKRLITSQIGRAHV